MGNFINKLDNYQIIPRDLIFDNTLSDRSRFVFCFMASKPNGWDFYLEPMAKEIGYSADTLRKYINELVKGGWLTKGEQERKEGNRYGAVIYTLNEKVPTRKNSDTENFGDRKNPTQINNIDNNKREKNKKTIDYEYVLPQYKETFSEWLEYKKQRKEGYKTEKSVKLCYDKLVKLSGDCPIVAQQIVEQSMANNWAGLFELKKENQYGNNRTNYSKKQEANNYAFQQYLEEGERIARGERVYTSDPNSADNPF